MPKGTHFAVQFRQLRQRRRILLQQPRHDSVPPWLGLGELFPQFLAADQPSRHRRAERLDGPPQFRDAAHMSHRARVGALARLVSQCRPACVLARRLGSHQLRRLRLDGLTQLAEPEPARRRGHFLHAAATPVQVEPPRIAGRDFRPLQFGEFLVEARRRPALLRRPAPHDPALEAHVAGVQEPVEVAAARQVAREPAALRRPVLGDLRPDRNHRGALELEFRRRLGPLGAVVPRGEHRLGPGGLLDVDLLRVQRARLRRVQYDAALSSNAMTEMRFVSMSMVFFSWRILYQRELSLSASRHRRNAKGADAQFLFRSWLQSCRVSLDASRPPRVLRRVRRPADLDTCLSTSPLRGTLRALINTDHEEFGVASSKTVRSEDQDVTLLRSRLPLDIRRL